MRAARGHERPPCARVMPRAQPRPKTSARRPPSQNRPGENGQNRWWARALVGAWEEVGPRDSEWGQTLQAASACPRDAPGTAAPENERPKAPVPKPYSGKGPKRGMCYCLGGGVGRSWSAGLGMGPIFASGLRVPAGCPVHSRAQKQAPEGPRPKTPCGKWPKRGVGYSLGGGVGRSVSAGLGMGPNFASGLRVPAGCPGHSLGQKRASKGPRPKTAQRKRVKTRGVL